MTDESNEIVQSIFFWAMIFAGTPTAVQPSGMFSMTTAPAPMVQCLPMVTFGMTMAPVPKMENSPMFTPPARWHPGPMLT